MKKYPLLVVGVGSIGERHVRCFQSTSRADVVICETQAARRDEVAARYHLGTAFADVAEALRHASDYAAVVLCVPAHLHIPLAIQFAEIDKHLLIEKPLSTTRAGLQTLMQLVAERKLTAGVAYVYRHHPVLRAMRRAVQDGLIGQPVEVIAVSGQHFPTYRPAYQEIYYARHATGGGAVQDALTHVVNACQWLIGPVDRLAADTGHQVLPGVEVEDTVHVIARHGPVMASYSLNQHQAPNELTITIVGTEGTVRFENHKSRYRWMKHPDDEWHDEVFAPLERDTLFVAQAEQFLTAVQQTQPPACSLTEAVATLDANLAILAAAETGQWQTVTR